MKRHMIVLTVCGALLTGGAGATSAQQTLPPEQFRAAFLAFVDNLASLPPLTDVSAVDPNASPEHQAEQRSFVASREEVLQSLQAARTELQGYSTAELDALQTQLLTVNWQALPAAFRSGLGSAQLTNIIFEPSCIGNARDAGIARFVFLGLRVIATLICQSNQCSGAAGSVPACVIAGVARFAELGAVIAQQQIIRCGNRQTENEIERRLGVTVSSRATEDSVGIRNDCDGVHCARSGLACTSNAQCGDFASMNLQDKLQTRLDIKTSTRSTQDSIDGQRSAPMVPSNQKSVRTVVDKTDEIVLPRVQRKMDELSAAIAAQGSLLRDLYQLQIRFKISENLMERRPRQLAVSLFQSPDAVSAPPKRFCSVSNTKSCAVDADCPPAIAGETCDGTAPGRTCSVSGVACADVFDCPVQPQLAETCVPQPIGQRGLLQAARDIVQESIDMTGAAGQRIGDSQVMKTRAVTDLTAGNYKQAFHHLRNSYREVVRPRVNP